MLKMPSNWRAPALMVAACLTLALGSELGRSQQSGSLVKRRADEDAKFQTAANKWMKVPFDLRNQTDALPSGDRQARDAYWDNIIGASGPLSDPNAQGRPMPIGDAIASGPEFGDLGSGVLIIGKFESYRAVLSSSRRSVYSEVQMRVQHVFGHPDAPIGEGELIDLDRPGGTIVAPWGTTVCYDVRPEEAGLQPQHIYLIRLGYNRAGNFYLGGYKTGELWDLTDGTVKPGNALQKHRAEHGMSEINGMNVDTLTHLLDKRYEEYQLRH